MSQAQAASISPLSLQNKKLLVAAAYTLFTLALCWLVFGVKYQPGVPAAMSSDGLVIEQLQFVSLDKDTEWGHLGGEWQGNVVPLPHDWKRHNISSYHGHYQGFFSVPGLESAKNWALYIPHVSQTLRLKLNGTPLNAGLRFDQRAHYWNKPILIPISVELLAAGENLLEIELLGHGVAADNYLSEIYLAPIEQLQPRWRWYHWLRVDSLSLMNSVLVFIALFMITLWWMMGRESVYAWSALAAISLFGYNLNFTFGYLPLNYHTWQLFIFACCAWTVLFFILASSRFAGLENKGFERSVFVFSCLGLLPLVVAPDNWIHVYGFSIWIVSILLIGVVAYINMFIHGWRRSSLQEPYYVLFGATLMITFGAHDVLLLNDRIDRSEPLLFSYGLFVLLVFHAWFVIQRFVKAMKEARKMNEVLDSKVKEREQQLQQNYDKLLQLEKRNIISYERERIMQDMHDGVGGHLISTLAILDDHRVSLATVKTAVQQCLTDLRMVINSVDPSAADLETLLGMFRFQIQAALVNKGIELIWQAAPQLHSRELTPTQSLHILRLLQEVVTNVIKHSGAKQLVFKTEQLTLNQQAFIKISLCDDGCGLAVSNANGRGLKNIQRRAEAIGAQFEFETVDQGCCAVLYLNAD